MTAHILIHRAVAADAAWVAQLLGGAFHPLAVAAWLVPDPHQRTPVLAANFRILVDHALAHGQVHTTDDRAAVAVWFPLEGDPLPEPPAYQQRVAAACGEATDRFLHLDELFEKHHPSAPHHHLALLAVRPARQRDGLGSALLRHYHRRLDRTGMPAYLEATSLTSRNLYVRHGYQVLDGPLRLPDTTPIWPMWRPPTAPPCAGESDAAT